MRNQLTVTLLSLLPISSSAQVGRPVASRYVARIESIAVMMRDSVGPDDVVIGVQVDSLCRMGAKRIISDFPGGCAPMALDRIGPGTELQLMDFMKFKCQGREYFLVVHCESDD